MEDEIAHRVSNAPHHHRMHRVMFDVVNTVIVNQAISLINLHFKVTCVRHNIFPRTLSMNVVVEDKLIMYLSYL